MTWNGSKLFQIPLRLTVEVDVKNSLVISKEFRCLYIAFGILLPILKIIRSKPSKSRGHLTENPSLVISLAEN